jgi:hypothetical protein
MMKALKNIWNWIVRYPLALVASVLVIVIATVFMFLGKQDRFNWGGIISRLFGKDEADVEATVPEDRKQEMNETDKHGYEQKKVKEFKISNNPFRDKSKVKTEDGKKIQLPEGVEDKDVKRVYEVDSNSYEVEVNSQPDDKDLEGLKNALIVFLVLIVGFIPIPSYSEECDGRCISAEKADELKEIVEHRQCMREALKQKDSSKSSHSSEEGLKYSLEPFQIVVGQNGRVYSKSRLEANLKWCEYGLTFRNELDVNVHMKDEGDDGDWKFEFRPRVRLGMTFHPLDIPSPLNELISPALLFEPFHFGLIHPEAHVGLKSFGLNAGVDITRNMDAFGGVGIKWKEPSELTPVLGVSLSFN